MPRARDVLDADRRRPVRRAGRDPADVTLVAVSKTVPPEALRDAVAAGLDLLGENRVQEAAAKVAAGAGRPLAPRRAAPVEQGAPRRSRSSTTIQSVDSVDSPGGSIGSSPRRDPAARYPVLLEVNVDLDPAKAGFAPDDRRGGDGGAPRAAAPRRPRADDGRAADRPTATRPGRRSSACASSRTAAAHAGRSSARSCRWG